LSTLDIGGPESEVTVEDEVAMREKMRRLASDCSAGDLGCPHHVGLK
jgi:hypothetical protein